MSAIAGIYCLDNRPVERTDLVRMIDILAHRGPNGSGVWHEGSIGLAHRMLWTTPESLLEELPLADRTGNLVLTADARIDNRDELIAALELSDRPTEKITDSDLILAAYQKWGESCPEKLLGDFAFAIWDGRKQVLFCARDHFGVKPFYYYSSERAFIFATEIKAILCVPEVPRRIDEVKVGDYLMAMPEDKEITFYQNILRLPPAHSIVVSRNRTQMRSYWSLDPTRELRLSSNEEYAEAFREKFTEAVRCRLRSTFPVGSMLSGGLDSSSITCVASQLLSLSTEQPLHTFSAIFDPASKSDESPFIKAVVEQVNLEPHYMRGDRVSPLGDIESVLWQLDEPLSAFNLFLNWNLYKIANNLNIRIILDGFDGDTTVSHGVGYLNELALAGNWLTLISEVRGLAKNYELSSWDMLWGYFWQYGVDQYQLLKPLRRAWRGLSRRVQWRNSQSTKSAAWSAALNPNFVRRIHLTERRKILQTAQFSQFKTEREKHYRTLTWGVMPDTLEVLDKANATFSLEPRYPFWDRNLVEFCLSLPPEQKIYQGWTRMVMRRAMSNILPTKVQWRGGKGNLGYNFDQVMLTFERKRLETTILQPLEAIENYVDMPYLQTALHRFISQTAKEDDAILVWKSVSLALWLEQARLTL